MPPAAAFTRDTALSRPMDIQQRLLPFQFPAHRLHRAGKFRFVRAVRDQLNHGIHRTDKLGGKSCRRRIGRLCHTAGQSGK